MRSATLSISALVLALSSSSTFVAADFHYGTAQCSGAQGGYVQGGFFIDSSSTNYCLTAFDEDIPGGNIPISSTKPSGSVCNTNVTVNLETLKWTSGSLEGDCVKTGVQSTCSPYLAQCTYTDVVECVSSICETD